MELHNNRNILLVDDEMIIGLSTKNSLERFGYKVIHASNGNKALEIVKSNEEINMILMDIDLGENPNGIETCKNIQKEKEIPVIFVSSHTEQDIISLTESVTSYGYIVKSSHQTVYDASIKMAYKLFNEKRDRINYSIYLETALENASEPIFITDNHCDIVFFNKAYLTIQGLTNPDLIEKKFENYKNLISVFSDEGTMLDSNDWASTRAVSGKSGTNVVFYVYHKGIKKILTNTYTYSPIYNELNNIIGSYVRIGIDNNVVNNSIIDKIIKEQHLGSSIKCNAESLFKYTSSGVL